jgi:hypothetical protein
VDIEPEPGCFLDTAGDVVGFFKEYLLPGGAGGHEEVVRRHIRICHDVCHSAVMQEEQVGALRTYSQAGLSVGKVQISAAIGVDLDHLAGDRRAGALAQLGAFAEDRYLHQTTVADSRGRLRFFEDLPDAVAAAGEDPSLLEAVWRTHFHVPLFLNQVGDLRTTADQIAPAIAAARTLHDTRHFEVETYAWSVLPAKLRTSTLAEGIAREILHARGQYRSDARS